MPYSGPGDKSLPPSVRKLPKRLREIWVSVFNDNYDPEDEGKAHRIAWTAVRNAQKEKQMNIKEIGAWLRGVPAPVKPTVAEKSVSLWAWEESVEQALMKVFPGVTIWGAQIFDDHVIANVVSNDILEYPEGVMKYYKIGYTISKRTLPDDSEGNEVIEEVTFTPREEWVEMVPIFTRFKAMLQEDGRTRWIATSSGGFEDRDGEVVSTAFLESAVKMADQTGERGPLLIFHVPGSQVGTCDFQAVIGEPGFLLESGLFDTTPAGEKAATFYRENDGEMGISIKFLFKHRSEDGVYDPPGMILERSILPKERAAFPWSRMVLAEVDAMSKQLGAEKRAELERVLGADMTTEIVEQLEKGAQELKEQGVRFKEVSEVGAEPEVEKEAEAEVVEAPEEEETKEEDERDLEASQEFMKNRASVVNSELFTAIKDAVKSALKEIAPETAIEAEEIPGTFEMGLSQEAVEAVAKQVTSQFEASLGAPIVKAVADLATAVAKMQSALDELNQAEEHRLAEKVADLPRATIHRLTRPTQAARTSVDATPEKKSFAEVGEASLYGK